MKTIKLYLALFIFCILSPIIKADILSLGKDEILSLLVAKDAQFDNVKIDYIESGKVKSMENPKVMIPYRYNSNAIVRGRYSTIIRELDPNVKPPEGAGTVLMPYQKWSNVGDLARQITRYGTSTVTGMFLVEPARVGTGPAINSFRTMQFALGVGFGKRIKEITQMNHTDKGIEIEGSIKIWDNDESLFKLTIDKNLIVRKAIINSNIFGKITRLEIETEGLVEKNGFVFAKTGGYKEIYKGWIKDGKISGTSRVKEDARYDFVGIQANLSDEQYNILTEMKVEPGMQVEDSVLGTTYMVGKSGKTNINDKVLMEGLKDNSVSSTRKNLPSSSSTSNSALTTQENLLSTSQNSLDSTEIAIQEKANSSEKPKEIGSNLNATPLSNDKEEVSSRQKWILLAVIGILLVIIFLIIAKKKNVGGDAM